MTSRSTANDNPATLYGPVSLFLGLIAFAGVTAYGFFALFFALPAGGLAAALGGLGLAGGYRQAQSAVGFATGLASVLYLFIFALYPY
ncbi:hypothetical protein [Streptomyces alkaliterrae]|uniref:Uncharacterized protein n=1 Tax=Streptomyces alkaliterrae TaxID=2213162 RepID=A0A5P0YVF4_9ACTN|nr:hypothetical protein [Streptomyces alkaliterrae]MBB1260145.1 hypothetical protein [Streptomyces alkaliterrae]MQS04275.1 hypothetical protein [Streptomyces alkaliterrae]